MRNTARTLALIAIVLGGMGTLGTALADNVNYDTTNSTFAQKPAKHARGFVNSAQAIEFLAKSDRVSFAKPTTGPLPATSSIRGQAGPVEDQGQCGSCWDFSLTTVLRGTYIMAGTDPGRLSFNYLLDCASTMQGCNGGDFSAADYFVSSDKSSDKNSIGGAPAYGADGNYTAGTSGKAGTCKKGMSPIANAVSYKLLGNEAGGTASFQDIAYVIAVLHQPVSIDVNATDDWDTFTGGTYDNCTDSSANDINHMVVIEGYDCETAVDSSGNCKFDSKGNLPAGVGTWLIRNSWGTSWGDKGYITHKATDSTGAPCNAVATDALYYQLGSSSK